MTNDDIILFHFIYSHNVKQHRENIQSIQYYAKSKNVHYTHQPGGLTILFIIMINLHRL